MNAILEGLARAGDAVTEDEWVTATKEFAMQCKERGGFDMRTSKDEQWFWMHCPFKLRGLDAEIKKLGGKMIPSPHKEGSFIGAVF